ncbi:hypothetical protein [Thermococcus eurythermalis]|nr:hypothetical protein [Thermococcus eurythermalis]
MSRYIKIQKQKEVIEDALLLYLESMHRERKAKKKKKLLSL